MEPFGASATADIVTFAAGALLTVCSAVVARRAIPRVSPEALYEDKDGAATKESQQQYSTRVQAIIASICAVAGLALSITDTLFRTIQYHERKEGLSDVWSRCGLWIFLVLQRVQVFRAREPVTIFRLSALESLGFLALVISYVLRLDHLFHSSSPSSPVGAGITSKALTISALILAVVGLCTDITVPRRPQLYHSGRPVDGQYTSSILDRFTYTWHRGLLAQSAAGKEITFDDLPALHHGGRAKDLQGKFNSVKDRFGGSMLKLIIFAHFKTILAQYALTLAEAVFTLGPQFALYQLLKLLEARDMGENVATQAAFWVVGLGMFIAAEGFLNNLMWWVNFSGLNMAIRSQLAALIFAKAMRRKDVKGVIRKSKDGNKATLATGDEEAANERLAAAPEKEQQNDDDVEASLQKSRQGVINLVGVDAKRIGDFAHMNGYFFGSAVRLGVSFTFLGLLVGWLPLLAGVVVQLLFMPINIYFSKRYAESQDVLMKVRDKKLAVVNEALGGIRQIKFSALERQWQKKILGVREEELATLWSVFIADTVLIGMWLIGPVVLSLMVISVYAILHGGLPASVAFTTIGILSQIEGTLSFLPELTTYMLDAYVSSKRIHEYMHGPEKLQQRIPGDRITFQKADVTWPSDSDNPDNDEEIFALRGVDLEFPPGELSIVSGRTGSGKSLLLNAILGEAEILSGKVTVPLALHDRDDQAANQGNWIISNALAFVSQQPWIENATFKNNILFGLPFDEKRYRAVIAACALDRDLEILTDGDQTEIGANGINLSGGQRWRVTLARALYSRASILVMDDIFSAVDTHVGKHIFENALSGELANGRTRILVTHHASLVMPSAKYKVHLEDGKVEYAGLVDDLKKVDSDAIFDDEQNDDGDDVLRRSSSRGSWRRSSSRDHSHSTADGTSSRHEQTANSKGRLSRTSTRSDHVPGDVDGTHAHDAKIAPKKFVEEEKRETGRIKTRIYKIYLTACGGWPFWLVVTFMFVGYEILLLGRSWVLKSWTQDYQTESHSGLHSWYADTNVFRVQDARVAQSAVSTVDDADDTLKYYLALYGGFALALCLEGTIRYLYVFNGSIKASRKLFDNLTYAVLRAPLRWLDTMPVGRILNRFTADFNLTDTMQAYSIAFAINNVMVVVGVVIAGVIVSPYILICAVVLLGACAQYAIYYIATAREIKRLESVAKSPIFELFSAALAGVSSIRAFDKTDTYITNMYERIDTHVRTLYYQFLLGRWLSWRLNAVGAVFAIVVAALIVSLNGMNASLAGFALGFTLQYADAISFLLRNISNVELGMNATERIIEFAEIRTEAEAGDDVPAHWPSEGRLEVKNLVVGYAPDLPPVLRGLTFSVRANERIGVVGRTGAGKSSLTLALFRFLEPREGCVYIDGVDISRVKLHDLRSRIAIIPQDPVLFSGTIRSNLDPFDELEEQPLQDALQRVHLTDFAQPTETNSSSVSISNCEGSSSGSGTVTPTMRKNRKLTLTTSVSESGLNLSQGQRQLLCLARAIVSRPKIMVLDEATSAVDKITDALIQRSIREEFGESTLLVIAHRLSTIADFDRILVMDQGTVAEYGTPRELLEKVDGVFKGMVESSGERDMLKDIIMGKQ